MPSGRATTLHDVVHISPSLQGVLIGSGVTFAGAALPIVHSFFTRRTDAASAKREELKTAMREYLAALDALTSELVDQPAPVRATRVDRAVGRAMTKAGADVPAFLLNRMLQRLAFGQRQAQVVDRVASASAHLRLVAPPSVVALMQEADAVGRSYKAGDEEWISRWLATRDHVRAAFRAQLDDY